MKCDLEQDWQLIAQNRAAWRALVGEYVSNINEEAEEMDDIKKDEKKNQQAQLTPDSVLLTCDHPSCGFVAVNMSGLVNHKQQKHKPAKQSKCKHCGVFFHIQGLRNHERFCGKRH